MYIKAGLILGLLSFVLYILYRVYQAGKKAEQLERLRREVNERRRADEILSNTINLNHDELNKRMHDKRKASNSSVRTKN